MPSIWVAKLIGPSTQPATSVVSPSSRRSIATALSSSGMRPLLAGSGTVNAEMSQAGVSTYEATSGYWFLRKRTTEPSASVSTEKSMKPNTMSCP